MLDQLDTESIDPGAANLDECSVAELAARMAAGDALVPQSVERALDQIVAAIEGVVGRLQRGGRLLYVGAGTPGRLGILDASECPPTFNTSPDQVVGVIAGGRTAITDAVEGAEDDAEAGAADLRQLGLSEADAVVGITASGRTPYVIGALRAANEAGAFTASLACSAGAEVSAVAQRPIEVVTGPEFVAGSTRLRAGTAQKLVLNMISTISMIRLGKTYGNLMIDVRATNVKLRARAARIVQTVTDAGEDAALAALKQSDWSAKVAIVVLLLGVSAEEAKQLLANRRLREVLQA